MIFKNIFNSSKTSSVQEEKRVFSLMEYVKKYSSTFKIKEVRPFAEDEIKKVWSATVVVEKDVNKLRLLLWNSIVVFIEMQEGSTAKEGDVVDLKKAVLIILEREGDDDRVRVLC
jgi:hypothetical protein